MVNYHPFQNAKPRNQRAKPGPKTGKGPIRSLDDRMETDLKLVLRKAVLEVKRKAKDIENMDVGELGKLVRLCKEGLIGLKNLKDRPEAGDGEGSIRFETHMADRKVN
jgi:hypothetical protein